LHDGPSIRDDTATETVNRLTENYPQPLSIDPASIVLGDQSQLGAASKERPVEDPHTCFSAEAVEGRNSRPSAPKAAQSPGKDFDGIRDRGYRLSDPILRSDGQNGCLRSCTE
jgi:hypothetical protein